MVRIIIFKELGSKVGIFFNQLIASCYYLGSATHVTGFRDAYIMFHSNLTPDYKKALSWQE